mmetsp:Transcript_26041/g.60035  ORF Transcript_26041/g.60035 Transcript_26041/m.60035 type:complete len:213 (+) Transcript_26041:877-1515(+)
MASRGPEAKGDDVGAVAATEANTRASTAGVTLGHLFVPWRHVLQREHVLLLARGCLAGSGGAVLVEGVHVQRVLRGHLGCDPLARIVLNLNEIRLVCDVDGEGLNIAGPLPILGNGLLRDDSIVPHLGGHELVHSLVLGRTTIHRHLQMRVTSARVQADEQLRGFPPDDLADCLITELQLVATSVLPAGQLLSIQWCVESQILLRNDSSRGE